MSLVARGSPWSELAKLPPRKYSAPTAVSARATLSAMSIAFSPTSTAIELDAGEETSSDLPPVESASKPCPDDARGCLGVVGSNSGLCQLSNGRAQARGGRDSCDGRLRAKQLVVPNPGSLRRVAHDPDEYSNRFANRPRIVLRPHGNRLCI